MGGCTSKPKTAEYEGLMKQQQPQPEEEEPGLKTLERSNSSVHKSSSQNTLQNLFVQHAKEDDVVVVDGSAPTLQDFLLHAADAKPQTVSDHKEEGPKTLQTVLESSEDVPDPPAVGEAKSDENASSSEEALDEDLASSSRELPLKDLHVIHKEIDSIGQLEDSIKENLIEVSSHVPVEENGNSEHIEASQLSLQAEEKNDSRQIEASQSSLQVEEKLTSETCEGVKALTEPEQGGTSPRAMKGVETVTGGSKQGEENVEEHERLSSARERECGATRESMAEGQIEGGSKQDEDDVREQEGHSSTKEKEDGGAVKSTVEGHIEGGSKQGEDDVGKHEGHSSAKGRENGGAVESIVVGQVEGGSKQCEDDVGEHGHSLATEREHGSAEEKEDGGALESIVEEKEDGGALESIVEGHIEGGSKRGEDDVGGHEGHSSAKEREEGVAEENKVEGLIEGGSEQGDKQGEEDVGEHQRHSSPIEREDGKQGDKQGEDGVGEHQGHGSPKEREDGDAQECIVEGLIEGGSKQDEDDVGEHQKHSSAKERENGVAQESIVEGLIEGGSKQGEDDVREHKKHSSAKERENGVAQESIVEGLIEGDSKQGEDDVGEHQKHSSTKERENGVAQESIVEGLIEVGSQQGEDDVGEHGHSSSKEREDSNALKSIVEGQIEAWNGKGERGVELSADEGHGSQVEATKAVESKEEEGGLECKCTDADDRGEKEVNQMAEGMQGLEGYEGLIAATEGQGKEDRENGQSVLANEKEGFPPIQGHPDTDGHMKSPMALCTETHGPSSEQATRGGNDDQRQTETLTYTAPVNSSNVDIAADIHNLQDQWPIEEKEEKAAAETEAHHSATIPSVILHLQEGSGKADDSSTKDRDASDSRAPQMDIGNPSLPAHESHSDIIVDSHKPEEDALEQPALQDKINQPHDLEEGSKEDKASSENNAPFPAKVEVSNEDASVTN